MKRLTLIVALALTFGVAHADQWKPDVFAGTFPVSVMAGHGTDLLEVTGPTGLRTIVFTITGNALFKDDDKAKITVTTTTSRGTTVSHVYRFVDIDTGPMNVSFTIKGDDPQFDSLFAQLKDATSVHAAVNDTDMRFDVGGLQPNFDVYTHQK